MAEGGKLMKLKAKLAEISSQIDAADQRNADAKVALIIATSRLEKAEAENSGMQRKIALLEKDLEDTQGRQKALTEKLCEKEGKSGSIESAGRELEEKEIAGHEMIRQLEVEVKLAAMRRDETEVKITEAEQKRMELQGHLRTTVEKHEAYKKRIHVLEETLSMQGRDGEFSLHIKRMEEEIKLLEAQLKEKQAMGK